MTISTKTHSVLLFPPTSLEELSSALEHADNQSTFFNRDLCVLSEKTDAPQEVILAKIMNIFHSSISTAPIDTLRKFESAFSLYCDSVGSSSRHHVLTTSAKEVVSEEITLRTEGKESKNSTLLLVTGTDNSWCGAMSFRIVQAIYSNIPILLSYGKFIEMLQGSFQSKTNQDAITTSHLKSLSNILPKLSDATQYSIYKHKESPLIVLLPKGSNFLLNLSNYELFDFRSMYQDAFQTTQGVFNQDFFTPSEASLPHIIETLSTEPSKHVLWAGHGLLDKEALGLPLESVSDVLNRTTNISWNLRSCYLLGNIRKILSSVRLPHSQLLISNGTVDVSYPLNEDESLSTYAKLSSSMKASPWTNGFNTPNHPHIVIEGAILPATLHGISDTLTEKDLQSHQLSYDNIERLYISAPHVKASLHLSKDISVLSGLAETNAQHLFDEIHTPSSLKDFIESAFLKRTFIKPGIPPDKRKKQPHMGGFAHHGKLLFMIKNLHCKDKHYKGVIYLSEQKTFFCEDDRWYDLKDNSPVDIKPILIKALHESRPAFIKEPLKGPFYQNILSTFNLPEDSLQFTDDIESSTLKSLDLTTKTAPIDITKPAEKTPEQHFAKAVFDEDTTKISELYPQMERYNIGNALRLCMDANLSESFKHILALNKDNFTDQLLYDNLNSIPTLIVACIKAKRANLLREVLSLSLKISEKTLYWTARYGDLATYELLKEATISPIKYEELLETAIEEENWEVARAITSDLQKASL